jgi:DNA-binding beta-propeller fold protein YncE
MKSRDRVSLLQIFHFVAVSLFLVWPAAARAQTVVATIPVGTDIPRGVAVNPVTNKIYVGTCSFHGIGRPPTGGLTVIDGATNTTTIIKVCPTDVAVNSVTNKIYVPGGVIDGATNSVTNLSAGGNAVAVNPVTNKIYVPEGGGIITVIDGATNSITTVTDPNANGLYAAAIAANPVTNKIYVTNNCLGILGCTNPGNVTVINGATNSTTTLTDPNAIAPQFVAVNPVTNKTYVANAGNLGDYPPGLNHGNITVIDGATNSMTTLADPNVLIPQAVAVNQTTNKIYVAIPDDSALTGNGGVAVIDGATNAISIVKDPNASYPERLAVDSVTNTIYVANSGCQNDACSHPGSVTVINGATNAVTTVINPNASLPGPVAINPTTNRIYVLNGGGNVTVIDGGATPTSHLLSVLLAGNESGTVTSNPAGVNCGTSCTASFAPGTALNLTASPAAGSTFSGWSGACTGSGSCNLTLNSDDFVTATFGSPVDFSVEPASLNLTAQRGGQVTDVITIAPLSGFFSTVVQLSCAVTPSPVNPSTALATCSLSPTSVTPGANSVASTLTVMAPTQSAELIPSGEAQLSRPLYAVFLPISLGLIGLGFVDGKSRNGRRSLWLLCSLFIAFVALQAGCGGGGSNQLTPPPQLNYTVTVTATSGALQHTNLVNVTVQ